jgi:hypothetical protein
VSTASTETAGTPPTNGPITNEPFVMTAKPTVEAFKRYFFDLPMAMANEALRFAAHRLEEQAKFASAVSNCKTPFELAETQSAFVRSTVNDYQKKAEMFVHQAQNSAT